MLLRKAAQPMLPGPSNTRPATMPSNPGPRCNPRQVAGVGRNPAAPAEAQLPPRPSGRPRTQPAPGPWSPDPRDKRWDRLPADTHSDRPQDIAAPPEHLADTDTPAAAPHSERPDIVHPRAPDCHSPAAPNPVHCPGS